jgi:hypothetical protein
LKPVGISGFEPARSVWQGFVLPLAIALIARENKYLCAPLLQKQGLQADPDSRLEAMLSDIFCLFIKFARQYLPSDYNHSGLFGIRLD